MIIACRMCLLLGYEKNNFDLFISFLLFFSFFSLSFFCLLLLFFYYISQSTDKLRDVYVFFSLSFVSFFVRVRVFLSGEPFQFGRKSKRRRISIKVLVFYFRKKKKQSVVTVLLLPISNND